MARGNFKVKSHFQVRRLGITVHVRVLVGVPWKKATTKTTLFVVAIVIAASLTTDCHLFSLWIRSSLSMIVRICSKPSK